MRKLTDAETVPIMMASGLKPLEPFPGVNKPWLSEHECGLEVMPQYANIKRGNGGCATCAGRKVDLAIVMTMMAAAGLTPLEPYPGNCVPWLSLHECGREVNPHYSNIQQGRGGCSICNRPKIDLDIVMATMSSAGLHPLEPYPGASTPWRCEHNKCGREVMPRYNAIQQGRGGCLVCGNGVDLEIIMATMSSAGLTPLVPYPGSDNPWLCKHDKCGYEVRPRYADIKRGGGCRSCSPHGYNPSKPGCVYLIETDNYFDYPHGVVKIGMAGGKFRRLDTWRQRGWTFLDVFHFDDGNIPPVVERDVLKWFNDDLGLEPCLSATDMGVAGGHTETISVADLTGAGVSVNDVRKKVAQLVKLQSPQLVAGGVR